MDNYTGRIFKFKPIDEDGRNLRTLFDNKLWISDLYSMNDPMDLGLYIDKKRIAPFHPSDNEIIMFQKVCSQLIFAASFTKVWANKRLWNYYSNGMNGIVIGYKQISFEKALKKMNLTFRKGKVIYGPKKHDFSDHFINWKKGGYESLFVDTDSLFYKDKSWKEEKEFRYSISTPNEEAIKKHGFLLDDIVPAIILVGYKVEDEQFGQLKDYCRKNGVTLNKYMPDFFGKKKAGFYRLDIPL